MQRVSLILDLEPTSASRPRVTRNGTFYLQKYRDWKRMAALIIKHRCKERFTAGVVLTLDVVCPRPKKPTNPWPAPDVDNFSKAVMDAITAAEVWLDDKQVVRLEVEKRWAEDGEEAHCAIAISDWQPSS